MPTTVVRSLLTIAVTLSSIAWAPTSSTVPDRPGPGPSGHPEPMAALRQGPGGFTLPTPNRTNNSQTSQQRRYIESQMLVRIKSAILERLGLSQNRTAMTEVVSGGSDHIAKQNVIKDQLDSKTNKMTLGRTNRTILRTILFGEKVANITGDGAVQFKLNQNSSRDLLVTAATVTVLVRPGRTGTGNRKSEPERVNIRIYALAVNDSGLEGAGGVERGAPLTEMSILAKRARIQRLLLPTSFVQRAIDSQESVLRLKIVCDSCGSDDDEDVLEDPGRKKRKRKRQPDPRRNLLRARHALPTTPYLTINSKRKSTATRARGRTQQTRKVGLSGK